MECIPAFKLALSLIAFAATSAHAAITLYNNDFPDGKIGTASRPDTGAGERESADDFLLKTGASLTNATFTGLLPANANVNKVIVEIYRVFPNDSDVSRTSGPPTFSNLPAIPTRVNSPSDVAFRERVSGTDLQYTTTKLPGSFVVA